MWQIVVLLVFGSCYSSAEHYDVNIVSLPSEPPAEGAGGSGSRIIGGTPAAIESYPYAVQIRMSSNLLSCGGSLITRRHVLSAAHCFVDDRGVLYSTSLFTVRAGATQLNTGGSTHRVSRIVNHERYNVGWARDNDVSVLVLASSVTLSSRVALAYLPAQGNPVPDNVVVMVVGWGVTSVSGSVSPVLNQVAVYTINWNTCVTRYRQLEQIYNQPFPVTTNMMCSGILDFGGSDACQGDSGGPVIYNGVVVGVTSWGESCAHPTYPGVNARVSAYTNWIHNTVQRYNAAPSVGQTSACLLLLSLIISSVFSNKL